MNEYQSNCYQNQLRIGITKKTVKSKDSETHL